MQLNSYAFIREDIYFVAIKIVFKLFEVIKKVFSSV